MTWNFFSITSLYFTVTHINKHKKRRSRLFHFQCLRSAPQQNLVQQPPTHQGCGLREPRRRQAPAVMSAREVRAIPVGPEFITSITFGMEADGLHGGDRSTGTVIRLLGPLRDRWGTQSFTLESKHEDPLFFRTFSHVSNLFEALMVKVEAWKNRVSPHLRITARMVFGIVEPSWFL